MLNAMDVIPGQGIDFDAVGRVLLWVLVIYVAGVGVRCCSRAG